VLAIAVAACGLETNNGVIDGWLVGPSTACQDRVVSANNVEVARGRCADLVAAAATALDHRDPGHAAVVAMQLHKREWPPNTGGGLQYVAVYLLADGSVRAIGVGWPGVATTPYTMEYGP
jgi:hypothetical protein